MFTTSFNAAWLDAIVSIEQELPSGTVGPIGTGFLFRDHRGIPLLITAKHVIEEDQTSLRTGLVYRLNTESHTSVTIPDSGIADAGFGTWTRAPSADLALRYFAYPKDARVRFKTASGELLGTREHTAPGTPVFALGFPLGLRSEDYARPIVRSGIVARSDKDGLIVDVPAFPGNSGGPVLYCPPIRLGGGLQSEMLSEDRLVGVVSSYIPYRETAISPHTRRPRIVFEENSGLTNVVPPESLRALLDDRAFQAFGETLRPSA